MVSTFADPCKPLARPDETLERRRAVPADTLAPAASAARAVSAESESRELSAARTDAQDNGHPPAAVSDHLVAAVSPAEQSLRQRLVAAGDAERERIERDLHDGAQQRLTALAIRLAIAEERFEQRGDDELGSLLRGFCSEVEEAIEQLRELAHGVYPPLLASYGLGDALASAATHAGQPVSVELDGVARYPREVESAVYFSCVAAIHNAVKHAGAAQISVRLWEGAGALRFSIADDGDGFDPTQVRAGAGITHMRDRLQASGGEVTIDSAPSAGTRVLGVVPQAQVTARRRWRKGWRSREGRSPTEERERASAPVAQGWDRS